MIRRHPLSSHHHINIAATRRISDVALPLIATLPPAQQDARRDLRPEVHRHMLRDCVARLTGAVACLHALRLDVGADGFTRAMTDDERTAVRLAAAHYRWPAVRDRDVREQLGMTPTRYWQYVGGLLERTDVLAEMPAEVHRLKRLRERRREAGRRTA